MGRFWLRKFSELLKQGDLDVFKRLKAIGLSHGQFRCVGEALHTHAETCPPMFRTCPFG